MGRRETLWQHAKTTAGWKRIIHGENTTVHYLPVMREEGCGVPSSFTISASGSGPGPGDVGQRMAWKYRDMGHFGRFQHFMAY
jgi:hypothetical protein